MTNATPGSDSDRLERIERIVSGLADDMANMKGDTANMKGDMANMKDDMAITKGWQTELAVERRAGQVFTRLCDGELLRIYPASELRYYVSQGRRNQSITRLEADRAESIDFLLEGSDSSGAPVLYAVEVSFTAGPDDIERAAQKADLLTRLLGREVRPAVVGADFTAHFADNATRQKVAYTYIRNGYSISR